MTLCKTSSLHLSSRLPQAQSQDVRLPRIIWHPPAIKTGHNGWANASSQRVCVLVHVCVSWKPEIDAGVSSAITFHLHCPETEYHTESEVRLIASKPQDNPLPLPIRVLGLQVHCFSHGFWGIALRFSYLHTEYSYPLSLLFSSVLCFDNVYV